MFSFPGSAGISAVLMVPFRAAHETHSCLSFEAFICRPGTRPGSAHGSPHWLVLRAVDLKVASTFHVRMQGHPGTAFCQFPRQGIQATDAGEQRAPGVGES